MKAGQIFRQFKAKNGDTITIRAAKWEDLPQMVEFANRLVSERDEDPNFGIVLDKKQTLESEAAWLAGKLTGMETGEQLLLVAEAANANFAGSAEVARGKMSDEFHHGNLGISVAREYRDIGIGLELVKTLIEECRGMGLKTLELEVFATNDRAIHVYESVGFKQVGKIPKKIFRNGRFIDVLVMAMEL